MRCKHRRKILFILGLLVILFLVAYPFRHKINEELYILYLQDVQIRSNGVHKPQTFNSTCSPEADLRGYGQRVISYAVFGRFSDWYIASRYLNPLKETVKQVIPKIYPGWTVRIYHDSEDEGSLKVIQEMFLDGTSHVDICNVKRVIKERSLGQLYPMTWRFLPLMDGMVDVMMSRDADSPLFQREVAAVQEWLASDRTFHVMRDTFHHCKYYILGGLWGVKLKNDRSNFVRAAEDMMFQNHYMKYGYDQKLLRKYLWPVARSSMIAHDSYCCRYYPSTVPFPTQREGRQAFVGMIEKPNPTSELKGVCPKRCRPQQHPDWTYC